MVSRGNFRPGGNEDEEKDSKAYLDKVENEWCDRIDAEVEVLVDGMVDIVGLASVGGHNTFQMVIWALTIIHIRSRTRTSSTSHLNHIKLRRVLNRWSEKTRLFASLEGSIAHGCF